jgi:dipeptidyl aminopeptidase/acylaminoacyl peptidase
MLLRSVVLVSLGLGCLFGTPQSSSAQDPRDTIEAEGVPPIPPWLDDSLATYRFSERASFQDWLAGTRRVIFLAESEGIEQAFLLEKPEASRRQLTSLNQPVAWVCAHPNRERIVIAHDDGGNERYRLLLHDLTTNESRPFTNGDWENKFTHWSPSGRSLALSSNARNGKDFDLYLVRPPVTASGRRLRCATGRCVAQRWSPDERRLAVVEYRPDLKESRVHLIDLASGNVESLPQPEGRPVIRSSVKWSGDGKSLYWLTNRDSEFYHLARYVLSSGEEITLTGSIPWDVEEFDVSGYGRSLVVVVNEDGWSRLHVIDAPTGRERAALRIARGQISSLTFRQGSQEFAFEWSSSRSPAGLYSFDLSTGAKTGWVKPRPGSIRAGSAPDPILIHYPTFDGREIPAYAHYPDPTSFRGPRPVLIEIHGGPFSQYRPTLSTLNDYLMGEHGVVLIHPNVRGSTGYGLSYERLDNDRKRADAVSDIGALLDWIATQPDLDADRVAVSGGSYGGYITLAALVRFGDRLRAGIDIAGVSSFETLMRSAPAPYLDGWRDEYGDERDPATIEYFRSISPLTNASKIQTPLLVVHGKNDPRVKVGEAEQIVKAVRQNGVPVWSIRFDGEGHGFGQRRHGLYLQHAQILFLKRYLLGL